MEADIVYESESPRSAYRETSTYQGAVSARLKQVVKPFILEGDLSTSRYGKQKIFASAPEQTLHEEDGEKKKDWSWINPYGRWGELKVAQD